LLSSQRNIFRTILCKFDFDNLNFDILSFNYSYIYKIKLFSTLWT
jgi:hypothetical protein